MLAEVMESPLTYRQRKNLPASAFALPKTRDLPLTNARGELDANHVKNAAARASMMRNSGALSRAQYNEAMRRIERAACKVGVERTCIPRRALRAAENPLSTGQKVAVGVGAGALLLGGIYLYSRSASASTTTPSTASPAPAPTPATPTTPSSTAPVPTPVLPAMPLPAPAPGPMSLPTVTDPITDPSLVSFAQQVLVTIAVIQSNGKLLVTDQFGQPLYFDVSNVNGDPNSDVFKTALRGFQTFINTYWSSAGIRLRTDGVLDYQTLGYMLELMGLAAGGSYWLSFTPIMPAPTSQPLVLLAQQALANFSQAHPNTVNWSHAMIDGNPNGPSFLPAIAQFQNAANIPTTGSLDWLTWAVLQFVR